MKEEWSEDLLREALRQILILDALDEIHKIAHIALKLNNKSRPCTVLWATPHEERTKPET